MSDRMKKQAEANRAAAKVQRDHGADAAAKRLEDRADELESEHVTDVTDTMCALISLGLLP